ncbi:DUF3301 domain-containing protein [Alcanivorax sp. JB21]|uniref:DUF3301 domain-containing protein n=1 Tax=Alcanivorax limicola TaxID=2874102 RepID=UPI001CBE387C|nr:DUF3301 domain-containing protein [Alcanivorax limicola]MBZ2188528.1 DUF3301 domain-containing protein [Alcanivorax limicola]
MTLFQLLLLAMAFATGALIWRGQGVRERALIATRQRCEREGLVLLDQSVALHRARPARDDNGRLCMRRVYQFEFTVTGGERYRGDTTMLGLRLAKIMLPPHRFET